MIEAERHAFPRARRWPRAWPMTWPTELMRAIEAKGKATLAVSGGTTPKTVLRHAVARSICHGTA